MYTAKQMSEAIGKTGTINADGFNILVDVLDARLVFARVDFKVKPVYGTGEKWISSQRVTFKPWIERLGFESNIQVIP